MGSLEKCDIGCLPVENVPKSSDVSKTPERSNPWKRLRIQENSIISYLQLESLKEEICNYYSLHKCLKLRKTCRMHIGRLIKELTVL